MKESTIINVNDLILPDGGFHCISLCKSLVELVKKFQLMQLPSVFILLQYVTSTRLRMKLCEVCE